jgi:cytidylate kinase
MVKFARIAFSMSLEHLVIAIDGYSSCGKSTVAKALARILGLRYIDSGAMYRAVTYYFLQNKIPFPQAGGHIEYDFETVLDKIHISFHVNAESGISDVYLNGKNVSREIRSMEVSENVSHVSAIKEVRQRMVHLQKMMNLGGGLVMDGRDIGTTVFPDADLKIFMTADPDIRARRRFLELTGQGVQTTLEEVKNNINSRDYEDSHRQESPLRKAPDAIILDNSYLNFDEQVHFVLDEIRKLQINQR